MSTLSKLITISPFGIDGNIRENWLSPKMTNFKTLQNLALTKFTKFKIVDHYILAILPYIS